MLDELDAAKHARRPVVPLGEPVVMQVIVPAADQMQAIHAAADRLLDADPDYAATCARLDADLRGILDTTAWCRSTRGLRPTASM